MTVAQLITLRIQKKNIDLELCKACMLRHSYCSIRSMAMFTAVMTQSMAFSPYKKPFEERLMRWEAQLSLVSEVIDAWLALQRAWMYLEPIFSSPDILQQLPQEGKKYSSVDRIWRKVPCS